MVDIISYPETIILYLHQVWRFLVSGNLMYFFSIILLRHCRYARKENEVGTWWQAGPRTGISPAMERCDAMGDGAGRWWLSELSSLLMPPERRNDSTLVNKIIHCDQIIVEWGVKASLWMRQPKEIGGAPANFAIVTIRFCKWVKRIGDMVRDTENFTARTWRSDREKLVLQDRTVNWTLMGYPCMIL